MSSVSLSACVIVCTRNRRPELRRCLYSLVRQTRPPDELVIVDGGDDSIEDLVAAFGQALPGCCVQYVPTLPGLTHQRNVGVAAAHAQILHFVDDDTVLSPGYLAAIHQSFEAPGHDDVVAVGGIPLLTRRPRRVAFLWRKLFLWSPLDGTGKLLPSGFPSYTWFSGRTEEHAVETLAGCACSFRAAVLETEHFDQWFDGYGFMEDVDLSYRVAHRGRVIANPAATLTHLESPSARLGWEALTEMQIVNHAYVHRKHLPRDTAHAICFWWSELGAGCWRLLDSIWNRKPGVLTGTVRGYRRVLLGDGLEPLAQRRDLRAIAVAATLTAAVLLPVLIFLYAAFGGPWVEASGDRVGEWVGARAKALAAAGQVTQATTLYRQALSTPFEDGRQWVWRCDELVSLLTDQGRFGEAVEAAAQLYEREPGHGLGAFRRVQTRMRDAGLFKESHDTSAWWTLWASERRYAPAAALGRTSQARALLALKAYERASNVALEAFATNASLETALEGARILRQGVRRHEAIPLLEYVIARDGGVPKSQAEEIRQEILGVRP